MQHLHQCQIAALMLRGPRRYTLFHCLSLDKEWQCADTATLLQCCLPANEYEAVVQVEELRELHAEWKQEYQIRRQMLIERAKVPPQQCDMRQKTAVLLYMLASLASCSQSKYGINTAGNRRHVVSCMRWCSNLCGHMS